MMSGANDTTRRPRHTGKSRGSVVPQMESILKSVVGSCGLHSFLLTEGTILDPWYEI